MAPRCMISLGVLVFLALAGCAPTQPYVFRSGEFDRTSAIFGREPADISSVTICYNKMATTPEDVRDMAVAECAKFDKRALFNRQSLKPCPLATPIAALYDCEAP